MSSFKEYNNPWEAEDSEWYNDSSSKWLGNGVLLEDASDVCNSKKTQKLKEKYKKMISNARIRGFNVAADNLEHFLKGTGTTRRLKTSWLRGFEPIEDAESRILNYAEYRNLSEWINEVKDGEIIIKTDYWDADITSYDPRSELSYASGASDILGNVYMTLSRINDEIKINGHVIISWTDDYDWHKGLGFKIPRVGYVNDTDALYLEKCAKARPFHMVSTWRFNFNGNYSFKDSEKEWLNKEWSFEGKVYVPKAIISEAKE